MKVAALFATVCALLLCGHPFITPAHAQETITVRKSGGQIDLSISPLTGGDGAAATRVLTDDLTTAGVFNLLPAGTTAGYTVRGSAGGGAVQGQLVDRGGTAILAKTYSAGSARAAAHEFADDIVLALTKTRGIASAKIAFAATRSGHKEIYVCDADGGSLRQLTNDANISVGPALSPDGRRLAYTGYKSGYADIYLIDLGSGARERIVKFPGTNSGAAFSPDGSRLAMTCSKDGNPELYVSDVRGGGARRLTRTRGTESSPTWAPDGSEIIYVSDDAGAPQLYRISAGGGSGQPVSTGYGYCTEPNWSPDGRKLAFNVRAGGGFAVAVLDFGGGGARVVSGGNAEDPCWGADSRHLVYSDGETVWLLDTVSGKKTRVAGGLGRVSEPTMSR